jgi:hypothetical protein
MTGKWSSLRGPCRSYIRSRLCAVSYFGSRKAVRSARELQLEGARQRGQEPLDTEAENATSLEAAIKQLSEDRDCEHRSMCDSDWQSIVTNCVLKCPINPITNPNHVYSHVTVCTISIQILTCLPRAVCYLL